MMKKSMPLPFPQAIRGKKGVNNLIDIFEVLRQVQVNIRFLDMIKQVPTYSKFLKDLCTMKKGLNVNKKGFLDRTGKCHHLVQDPSEVQRPRVSHHFSKHWRNCVEKALLDLGASVNLLPYSVYKKQGLGELKPTTITLSLANRSMKIPQGIVEDVLV